MNDPIPEQHWAVAMVETVCVAGCTCILCARSSDADAHADHTRTTPRSRPRRHVRRSLPSSASIMEVFHPSSHLGTPPAFPDPPSHPPGDAHPFTDSQGNHRERTERTPVISTTTTAGGMLAQPSHHDLLVEGASSPGAPSGRVPPAELNVGLGIDVLEEAEPPPTYSRFNESQSRLPAASDLFGPYPLVSVLNPPAS